MTAVIAWLRRELEPPQHSAVCSSTRHVWEGWFLWLATCGPGHLENRQRTSPSWLCWSTWQQSHVHALFGHLNGVVKAALCQPWHTARWEFICGMTNSCIFSSGDSWDECSEWGWVGDFIAALKVAGLDAASAGLVSGSSGTSAARGGRKTAAGTSVVL